MCCLGEIQDTSTFCSKYVLAEELITSMSHYI